MFLLQTPQPWLQEYQGEEKLGHRANSSSLLPQGTDCICPRVKRLKAKGTVKENEGYGKDIWAESKLQTGTQAPWFVREIQTYGQGGGCGSEPSQPLTMGTIYSKESESGRAPGGTIYNPGHCWKQWRVHLVTSGV